MALRKWFIFFLSLCLLPTAGCWDRKELEEKAFVITMTIDRAPNGLLDVAFRIAVPSEMEAAGKEGGGKPGRYAPSKMINFAARSLPEAFSLASATVEREINFSQLRVILIGDTLAKDDLTPILDTMTRYQEFRRTTYVQLSLGPARDIPINASPIIEQDAARYIENLEAIKFTNAFSPSINYHQFLLDLTIPGRDAYLPILAVNKKVSQDAKEQEKKPLRPTEQWQKDIQTDVSYEAGQMNRNGGNPIEDIGTAIFKAGKMVAAIDGQESRSFLLLHGQLKEAIDQIPDPNSPGLSVDIRLLVDHNPNIQIDLTNPQKPNILIQISMEINLLNIQSSTDYSLSQNVIQLEKAANEHYQQRVSQLIRKAQTEWHAEPFGFSDHIRTAFPTYQDLKDYNWREAFCQANVTVETDVRLRRTGITFEPPKGLIE